VIIELLKYGDVDVKYRCYDRNDMLIELFNEIKYDPEGLIDKMKPYEKMKSEEDFYRVRNEFNKNRSADKFLYLNKTCFRGMYRVNKKNEFNSSFNKVKNPAIYCKKNIIGLSELFNTFDVTFEVSDYRDVDYENCVAYLDPPYYDTQNGYSSEGFSHREYVKFLNLLQTDHTVKIIHSNSAAFRNIYESDENILEIEMHNRMNSKNPGQKRIELLFFRNDFQNELVI
jgi:DNA adenine methylase